MLGGIHVSGISYGKGTVLVLNVPRQRAACCLGQVSRYLAAGMNCAAIGVSRNKLGVTAKHRYDTSNMTFGFRRCAL